MRWDALYPALHRALADNDPDAFPRPTNDSLERSCAHWGALHYALSCLLGWEHVGRGLANWYRDGRQTHDSPVLALVQHVWGTEDLLDYYAAWSWKPPESGWMLPQSVDPFNGPSPTWLAQHSLWPDEDWWRSFVRRGQVHHHDPFYGGSDPLHLSIHTGREDQHPSSSPVLHVDSKARHAILITEGLQHWLADLAAIEGQLPSMGEHSWHVEVFDRRAGWLGLYRRSRETGRWFTGKHSTHVLGADIKP